MMGHFMSQKTVPMTFFTTVSGTFSLPEIPCVLTSWTVYSTQARCGNPMFSLMVKFFFFIKIGFSVSIIDSSVNYILFALLSHQKFDDRSLFKPGALCSICCHFELPQNKYFCVIRIIFAINQF